MSALKCAGILRKVSLLVGVDLVGSCGQSSRGKRPWEITPNLGPLLWSKMIPKYVRAWNGARLFTVLWLCHGSES